MPLLLLTSLLPPLSLTASLPRSPSPCQHFLLTRGVADLKVRLRRLFFDLLVCSFLSFTCSNSGLKKKSGFGLNEAATETLWPFFVLQKKKNPTQQWCNSRFTQGGGGCLGLKVLSLSHTPHPFPFLPTVPTVLQSCLQQHWTGRSFSVDWRNLLIKGR